MTTPVKPMIDRNAVLDNRDLLFDASCAKFAPVLHLCALIRTILSKHTKIAHFARIFFGTKGKIMTRETIDEYQFARLSSHCPRRL